jgi:hypothetical protein
MVNNEFERIWTEIEEISRHLPEETEEKHEKNQPE